MPGFQTSVSVQPAPAVEGDFASTNPRWTVDAGPGALVTGAAGVAVGRFAWIAPPTDPDGTNAIANNFGAGLPAGFVHREMQGLITTFLSGASMLVPPGFAITLFSGGDFWVKNNGTGTALPGMKAYANYADGKVSFAAAGSINTGTVTGSIGGQTVTFNGSITGGILTVNSIVSGLIVPGGVLSGGTGMITGTKVVSQISGAANGVGTYYVDTPVQTVAAATLTETYGLLTVASGSGVVGVGDLVSGSGVTTGTIVTGLGTGTGGTGTYYVSPSQTVGSITLTLGLNIETKWIAMSAGGPGELVKMSAHPLG